MLVLAMKAPEGLTPRVATKQLYKGQCISSVALPDVSIACKIVNVSEVLSLARAVQM